MNIAFYVPAWPPGELPNGIVAYAASVIPILRSRGHSVRVLTFAKSEAADALTIDLNQYIERRSFGRRLLDAVPFGNSKGHRHLFAQAIVRAASDLEERGQLDVLEIEDSFGWHGAVAASGVSPLVVRLHGPWFLTGPFASDSWSAEDLSRVREEGRALATASNITSPAADVLKRVENYYHLDLSKATVIPNPIQTTTEAERWQYSEKARNSILFVGRFDSGKGGDLVLRCFARLAQRQPDASLTFVGPDIGIVLEDGTKRMFSNYVNSVVPKDVRSRIRFTGRVTAAEVRRLRTLHGLTLVASRYEVMPYSVLEAMSLGSPIVATNVGGIPEIIQHEVNGVLSDPDPVSLSDACERLLLDPEKQVQIGLQAWEDCREMYSPVKIATITESLYSRLL